MTTGVRVLAPPDLPALKALVDADPVMNIFLASRLEQFGLDSARLGCQVLGFFRDGELQAALHSGHNLFPLFPRDDPEALAAFVEQVGVRIVTRSILGPAASALRLHTALSARWGESWGSVRSLRPRQPVLQLDADPAALPDKRVRRISVLESGAYYDAAVKMYSEEVGVTPVDATNSYKFHVHELIRRGRAFGATEAGRVFFKTDIGASCGGCCQIQGVWLDPALRGQHLGAGLVAGAIRLVRQSFPTVTLYVNDYNVRALRIYTRLGMAQVGELATVLY
jgi:predicted GNAT family acetyltransferase